VGGAVKPTVVERVVERRVAVPGITKYVEKIVEGAPWWALVTRSRMGGAQELNLGKLCW